MTGKRERFISTSPEATFGVGRFLGEHSLRGQVFLLEGDLGAGKTLLAKGLAAGIGLDPDTIVSPSFLIIREHAGVFAHVDLYKVADPEELFFTGFSDCLGRGMTIAIEWAQKLPLDELCGAPALEIEIAQGEFDSERFFSIGVPGPGDTASRNLLDLLGSAIENEEIDGLARQVFGGPQCS